MYLVTPDILKAFLDKKKLIEGLIPKPNTLPCIIEFRSGGVVMAKVEVSSFEEFLSVVKFGNTISEQPKNKYWIRGEEWVRGDDGKFIEELIT